MVVETTTVSVVTKVVCSEAGQSVTVEGQAVIVAVRVLRTVDVVLLPSVSVAWEGSVVVARVVDREEVNVVSAFIEEVVIAVVVVVVVIVEIVIKPVPDELIVAIGILEEGLVVATEKEAGITGVERR
jgi:hypothetical protein